MKIYAVTKNKKKIMTADHVSKITKNNLITIKEI